MVITAGHGSDVPSIEVVVTRAALSQDGRANSQLGRHRRRDACGFQPGTCAPKHGYSMTGCEHSSCKKGAPFFCLSLSQVVWHSLSQSVNSEVVESVDVVSFGFGVGVVVARNCMACCLLACHFMYLVH